MSLINEALKKAQRQRAAEASTAGDAESAPGRVAKRPQAMRAQTVILLAAAATVLIVFSVVVTVYWLNAAPEPKRIAAPVTPKPAPAAASDPRPIVVPAAASPAGAAPASTPPAAVSLPAVATVTPTPTAPTPVSTVATPAPEPPSTTASAAPKLAPDAPDPRIQSFVDTVRVTGIRSSGSDSKVLMNDRVYRVNDLVDRALGVKLIRVAPDTLTFADARGVTYTKSF